MAVNALDLLTPPVPTNPLAAKLQERTKTSTALTLIARDLVQSARTAALPDGRVHTYVSARFLRQLLDHHDVAEEGDLLVAVEERHLRRFAAAAGTVLAPDQVVGAPWRRADLETLLGQPGVTVRTLAAELGVSESSVYLWRQGKTTPAGETQLRMLQLLAERGIARPSEGL